MEKKFIKESFTRGGSVVFGFQTWKARERDTFCIKDDSEIVT